MSHLEVTWGKLTKLIEEGRVASITLDRVVVDCETVRVILRVRPLPGVASSYQEVYDLTAVTDPDALAIALESIALKVVGQ